MKQLRDTGGSGPQARKLLDTLFRSVHNLKASASADGLTRLAAAAHEFENVLHSLRTGQPAFDGNVIQADVWNGLKRAQKHAVQQSIAEGARLFLVQAVLDVGVLGQQFRSLNETLSKNGEVISAVPSASKEYVGKVNFRILYAASEAPAELSNTTVEEISVVRSTATNTFEQQMPVLERAFHKFAAELLNPEPISTDDMLARALRAGEAAAEALGKDIEFEVKSDPALLDQLPGDRLAAPLLHLVRNAVDHGIDQRGKVTIEIARRDDLITITVTDDGHGIAPALLDEIFQPGFSTKTDVSDLSGRGVGLDAVKASIEELGGTIRVHSTPGHGASFELTLPIRAAQPPR